VYEVLHLFTLLSVISSAHSDCCFSILQSLTQYNIRAYVIEIYSDHNCWFQTVDKLLIFRVISACLVQSLGLASWDSGRRRRLVAW